MIKLHNNIVPYSTFNKLSQSDIGLVCLNINVNGQPVPAIVTAVSDEQIYNFELVLSLRAINESDNSLMPDRFVVKAGPKPTISIITDQIELEKLLLNVVTENNTSLLFNHHNEIIIKALQKELLAR